MNDAKNYVVRQACQGFYPGQGCRFPTPCNNVATVAGNNTQGFVDGPAASAQFGALGGVSFSGTYTYMCDSQNHVIRTLDTFANVSTFAGTGTAGFVNGYRTTAQFNCPTEVAWDSTGNMYVADAGNNVIRKVDTAGNVTTFAGTGVAGYADGPGGSAQFNMPCGIFFNPADNFLYVADSGNNLIRRIALVQRFISSLTYFLRQRGSASD